MQALSCRVCLKMCTRQDLNVMWFKDIFKAVTRYDILDSDIAKKICRKCLETLISAMYLLQQVHLTQSIIVPETETRTNTSSSQSEQSLDDTVHPPIQKTDPLICTPEILPILTSTPSSSHSSQPQQYSANNSSINITFNQCIQCGKVFQKKQYLVTHINRVHSTKPPVSCHVCGKSFSIQKYLNAHAKTHSLTDQ